MSILGDSNAWYTGKGRTIGLPGDDLIKVNAMAPAAFEAQSKYRGRWRALAAVLAGSVMGPLDASIVYVSLPSIAQQFRVEPAAVGWVSMGYLLIMGGFLLSFGRLGDMLGFKRIYLSGLAVFTLASLACSLAGSLASLILYRAVQAVGAGMSLSMTPAIIADAFPPEERGRALGINGMVVAAGLALGPSLGGLLVDLAGWRSIFWVNLPIGLAAVILAQRVLPARTGSARSRFDWPGSLLGFFSLLCLLLSASQGQLGRGSGWSSLLGVLGLGLAVWFVRWEGRAPQPILDLSLFRQRWFSVGNAASLLNFVTQYVIVFLTPFLLQQEMGLKPGRAGALMTAFPLTVLVVAPVAGALSDRLGQRSLALAGSCCCTAAAFGLSCSAPSAGPPEAACWLGLFGLGTGLFQTPNTSAVMGAVPPGRLGIASGVLATARNVGMVFGIALGGTILSAPPAGSVIYAGVSPFLHGIQAAYLAAAFVSALATAVLLTPSDSSGPGPAG